MNMKKIINDYIGDLEMRAKQSDKYFIERNELYIEKEQIKDILRKWKQMPSVSVSELNDFIDEIYNIVFKAKVVQKRDDDEGENE